MSTNEIYTKGSELVFPVHTTVESNDLVQVGTIIGVSQNGAVTGEDGDTYSTLKLDGVFAFTIKTGVTLEAGDVCYGVANGTSGIVPEVTATDSEKLIGAVVKLGNVSGTALVRLMQSV
jgi:predicted RecA/RadA family phage recombinase